MKTTTQNPNKVKAALFTFSLSLLLCNVMISQDNIALKTGEEINAKVSEVTDTQIKFKKTNYPDGPLHILNKSEVYFIKYENGTRDVFNQEVKKPAIPEATTYVPYQTNYRQHSIADDKFDPDTSDFAKKRRKNFSGPRVGFTYISAGTSADYLANNGKQNFITQFGWQFEGRLFTVENGTSGMIEFVPLIGGVEQGMFIPSASLLIGLRGGTKTSYEFAMGPNLSVVPNYKGEHQASLGVVIAAGTSFKKGNVNFPVNLAFVPSVGSKESVRNADGSYVNKTFQTGWRLSLVVGFNSRTK